MHRWIMIALVACVGAACDDNGPTSPSNVPYVFSAALSPANEVPPVTNAESAGTGAAQITIVPSLDSSGAISGGTVEFFFQLSGFPGPLTIVGAHIHPGSAGVNGPAAVSTGLTAAASTTFPSGTGEYRVSGVAITAANLQSMLNNPSGWYFNVHSPLNPGGFARGQLARVQ